MKNRKTIYRNKFLVKLYLSSPKTLLHYLSHMVIHTGQEIERGHAVEK